MAGYLTDYGKGQLLSSMTTTAHYIGLATSLAVGSQPTLSNISEVQDANYARLSVTFNSPTGSPAYITNNGSLTFAASSGFANNISNVNYVFLTDASTGNSLAAPTGVTAGSATSGGSFAAGSYYWVITAVNTLGETIGSTEVNKTVTANQEVPLSWSAVSGATGYNVYRGSSSGQEGTLVNGSPLVTTSYTDTGSAGTAKTPPTVNTASVGNIWYVWQLTQPTNVLSGKPIYIADQGLIIE